MENDLLENAVISLSRLDLKRPGLFIGRVNWELFITYMHGYTHCLSDVYGEAVTDSGHFQKFVQEKYPSDDPSWSNPWWIIIRNQVSSDAEAFTLYGKLLDEYEEQNKLRGNDE